MKLEVKELDSTIISAFLSSRKELLPENIRNDKYVDWILGFDSLKQEERNQREKYPPRNKPFALLVSDIMTKSLTPLVSFYFASLFHIGRQWQVADLALNSTESALSEENLQATAEANKERLRSYLIELEIPEKQRTGMWLETLTGVLNAARKKHSRDIKQAQLWWNNWQSEVNELFDIVDHCTTILRELDFDIRFNEYDRYYLTEHIIKLITYNIQSKRLFSSFQDEGISLKNLEHASTLQASLSSSIPLLMFMMIVSDTSSNELLELLLHEYQHIYEEESILIDKRRYAPLIESIENQLLESFGSKNPFDEYSVLNSPPDWELNELWYKCRLPDGAMFFYAKRWVDSLEASPYFYTSGRKELAYREKLNDEDLASYARSADSTVKRNWITYQTEVGETIFEKQQRLFEKEWIKAMAIGAFINAKNKPRDLSWNPKSFSSMVSQVVQLLNSRGYNLRAPELKRITSLWNQIEQGKSSYEIEW